MAFNHQRLQCISFHHREIHLQLPYVAISLLHTGPSVNRNIMIIVLVSFDVILFCIQGIIGVIQGNIELVFLGHMGECKAQTTLISDLNNIW